ncbi:alpha/beta hydrolase [Mycobacterium sp. Aquia_216]|uniref:alpha/beta fold hydrolase n=1 Tax=Mycobacterium sp. Aquia_216 TaxID=2991729 RepID=UPI00227AD807|nr:alpha/beta hydrolase [Mycobacterium sp. Aquia_216]WAJ43906.1 alpha/beta hydrolase [Mycobacterium sp. Aquia_216]
MKTDDTAPASAGPYTFVLVHGGCHDGSAWQPVVERLQQLGHTAYAPTVAGHGKNVAKNVTHAQSVQSVVDFVVSKELSDFVLVGHGYAGTIISKVVEAVPDRVRRVVFWSAFVLNDGETTLENLPGDTEGYAAMAAESDDNTFTIPFDVWRDVFINDGDAEVVERAYAQLSPEPFGPWVEPLEMAKFHRLATPRSYLVGTEDLVLPPGEAGWHPRMSSRLGTFRLVQMPGSHEAIFTRPITVADKIVEAGRD